MSSNGRPRSQALKLPSIKESIAQLERIEPMPRLQTFGTTSSPQLSSSRRAHPTFESQSFNAAFPGPHSDARRTATSDMAGHVDTMLHYRPCSYHSSSPDSERRLSNMDSGPSTASTSPYNGSSPRTSRASSLTLSSLSGETSENEGPNITKARVQLAYNQLTEILELPPSERAADSREKHKFDERRRRGMHKNLLKMQEDLSVSVLGRLQDPNTESYKEGLHPQLVRATLTGNHKKHNTKTAISLAQIIQVLEQASRILSLEDECSGLRDMLNEVGISPPVAGQSSYSSSPASKRRRSSLVEGSQRSRGSASEHSSTPSHSRHSRDFTQARRH